ncbi:TEL2-interacting protein 1 [Geranomyces michiganensis]|nr:TEL2-interacting protein 1 [Geranomyces michiganensis]
MNPVKRDADNPLVRLEVAITELASGPHAAAVLDGLCDYISFPLLQLIKYPSPSLTAVESALLCFKRLLQGCSPGFLPIGLYRELLVGLPFLISNGKIGHVGDKRVRGGPTPPEELKLAGVQCLAEMLRRVCPPPPPATAIQNGDNKRNRTAESATYKRLDRPEYQPTLAHIVVVLLDVIDSERNVDLQCLALETLFAAIVRVNEPDYVAQFLPGVSSTLVKVIVRDEKQSHRIIAGCLETLAAVVTVVLNDEVCSDLLPKEATDWSDLQQAAAKLSDNKSGEAGSSPLALNSGRRNTGGSAPPTIVRDKSWHRSAVLRLNRLFANSFTIRDHENWRVRHAFLTFSAKIIRNCSRSLADSIPLLVETLVGYVNDNYPEVAIACREQIESVAGRNQFSLNAMLKENFYNLMMALPQRVMQPDDRKKLAALQIVIGYMLLLKDGIRSSLNAVIDKLSIGLLRIWTFDHSDVKLVEDRMMGGSLSLLTDAAASSPSAKGGTSAPAARGAAESNHFPRHRYRYFHDEHVELALCQVCRLLGHYGNAAYLTDHFLAYVTNNSSIDFQAQAIKIINEMCLGAAGLGIQSSADEQNGTANADCANSLVRAVAREYLQSPLWNEPTSLGDVVLLSDLQRPDARRLRPSQPNPSAAIADRSLNSSSTGKPKLADFNAAICKMSLLLEGCAIQSRILGADFEVLLMDALYLILEKVADSSRAVSTSAMAALQIVATSCGHPKAGDFKIRPHGAVVELIVNNIDYLVNVVSRRLRYIATNPKAPLVLQTAIKIAGVDILPFMNDTVDEIMDALDEWHLTNERLVIDLVAVLQELIEAMNKGAVATDMEAARTPSSHSFEPTASENTRPANVEFAGCSDEMIAFYLKYGPAKSAPTPLSTKKPKIQEIEKYFMDRAKADADVPDATDLTGHANPVPLAAADDDHAEVPRDEKPDPPTHAQALALKVLEKVYYLLSAPDPRLRTRCLRIVTATFPVLASRPTDLNPAIHRFWPVIIRRLGDAEHFVAAETLALVAVVCDLSPEFVVKRVADDLIPRFTTLVDLVQKATRRNDIGWRGRRSGNEHGNGHGGGGGVHSRLFTSAQVKVQLSTLTTVATLLRRVPLSSAVLRALVDRVVPFLNSAWYDANIVDAAVDVLVAIANDRDSADVVWLAVWAAIGAKRIDGRPRRSGIEEPGWLRPCRMPPWMVEQAAARRDDVAQFLTAGVRVLNAISPDEDAVSVGSNGWIETKHAPTWVK